LDEAGIDHGKRKKKVNGKVFPLKKSLPKPELTAAGLVQ
jgi:hypothetical protein